MDELAGAARVGKATIYRRWTSKESIIWDAWLTTDFPAEGEPLDDLRNELAELIHRLCRWHSSGGRPLVLTRVLESRHDSELAAIQLNEYLRRAEAPVAAVLRRAQLNGRLPDDTDCEAILDALIGACVYRLLIRGQRLDQTSIARIINSVVPAPAEASTSRRNLVGTVVKSIGTEHAIGNAVTPRGRRTALRRRTDDVDGVAGAGRPQRRDGAIGAGPNQRTQRRRLDPPAGSPQRRRTRATRS